VHLGSGIWVDEEKWHQLQVTQGDSKYTKNLAVMIWGTDVLKNRSVTGVATKKKKDAIPKPPLSPHKLSIVRECLYDRIAQETVDETEIAQRLSKVNKYICEKIMDINKSSFAFSLCGVCIMGDGAIPLDPTRRGYVLAEGLQGAEVNVLSGLGLRTSKNADGFAETQQSLAPQPVLKVAFALNMKMEIQGQVKSNEQSQEQI
ncbi:hypothetical protein U0070_008833, partial [Myodes glareolus]